MLMKRRSLSVCTWLSAVWRACLVTFSGWTSWLVSYESPMTLSINTFPIGCERLRKGDLIIADTSEFTAVLRLKMETDMRWRYYFPNGIPPHAFSVSKFCCQVEDIYLVSSWDILHSISMSRGSYWGVHEGGRFGELCVHITTLWTW